MTNLCIYRCVRDQMMKAQVERHYARSSKLAMDPPAVFSTLLAFSFKVVRGISDFVVT